MISEEQENQAALYALDLLGAAEGAAFERELSANGELRALVDELREAAAAIALTAPQGTRPAPSLKDCVMKQIASEARSTPRSDVITPHRSAFSNWVPWAIAAALALFCGVLAVDRAQLRKRVSAQGGTTPVLVALAATESAPAKAAAVVAWRPERQKGVIKVLNLPAAGRGKDYQLWVVDAAHKDPVSAGILRTTVKGETEIAFQPIEPTHQVEAFAISLEREGGVPKKEGPILLVGKI